MKKEVRIWALLMLANELARKDYVSEYGEYSAPETYEDEPISMTDEVEAVFALANSKETLDNLQDLEQFLHDFLYKAAWAGWELPWEDGWDLLAAAKEGASNIATK